MVAMGAADMDGSARVLVAVADLHVECEHMGHLEGLLLLGKGASVEVDFGAVVADDVEEVLFHCPVPCGWRPVLDRYEVSAYAARFDALLRPSLKRNHKMRAKCRQFARVLARVPAKWTPARR